MDGADGSPNADDVIELGPKLVVGQSEPFCWSNGGPLEVV
jgi:hypothetical protein